MNNANGHDVEEVEQAEEEQRRNEAAPPYMGQGYGSAIEAYLEMIDWPHAWSMYIATVATCNNVT